MYTKARERNRTIGATLLETILSTALFALLCLALFVFYDMAKMKWNVMFLRHNLQVEARRAIVSLTHDLRKTDYGSVDIYVNPRVTPPGWSQDVPRWSICMVGLSDWTNPN